MRRIVMLAGLLVPSILIGLGSAGCSNFRDLFSAHADVAAEAGGQQLGVQRLVDIVTSPKKGVQVNRETMEFVANQWIDYVLFAHAAASAKLPSDSAGIAETLWPEISEIRGSHWHDTLMARRGVVSPAAVDSVYGNTDIRVLQHILFGVKADADSATRKAALKKAETTLKQVRSGSDFGALAAKLSDDPGSRPDSGYLPPSPRGRFVVTFDSAAWMLAPGQTSGIVQTAYGYHIIKRPPLASVRGRVSSYVANEAGARLDSIYMDSLATLHNIEIVSGAPAAMRAASAAPEDAVHSTKTLVRFKGGELTVRDYIRWIRALPPQYAERLKTADDMALNRFARILTQNVLLLQQADSAKVGLTSEEWSDLTTNYRANLDSIKAAIGLDATVDTTTSLDERLKVADLKVERFFDQLISGQRRLRPIPPALAGVLRERFPHKVLAAGLSRATELAKEKARPDSTMQGPLQRAPGGPPLPRGMAPGSAVPNSRPVPAPTTPRQPAK